MSDFKFNCSNCGQHLSGDVRHAGLQIVCPACGKPTVVPPAPAGLAITPSAPPVAGAAAQPRPRLPQKTSGLAIASLVCSIGSFIIIPLGFIPGIICGHMAKKRIAATPGLQGGGLAKAGVIIGYVALGLNVLALIALTAFFFLFAARVKHAAPHTRSQQSVAKSQSRVIAPAEKETTDTAPDGSGWTMQLAGVETPSETVTGRIHGEPFKLEKVTLMGDWLKFAEGTDFIADREMDVVLFVSDITKLSGRTFSVPKKEFGNNPHIWMKWKEPGGNMQEQRCFTDRYALRLEFGQLSDGKLPGKIYLCLPDEEKSFIVGTFEAPVKNGR